MPDGQPLKAAIWQAETTAAGKANTERLHLQAAERARAHRHDIAGIVALAGAFVLALLALGVFLRDGRELRRPADIPEYWHDPPDYPPAYAQALLRFGSIKDDAFSVTIVDLAQRG
ncbi:MAG: hypothetical protein ACR2KJ_03865 [Jatrophihabitans sp.]